MRVTWKWKPASLCSLNHGHLGRNNTSHFDAHFLKYSQIGMTFTFIDSCQMKNPSNTFTFLNKKHLILLREASMYQLSVFLTSFKRGGVKPMYKNLCSKFVFFSAGHRQYGICPNREGFKNRNHGLSSLRGGGVPPLSVNFFPLTFWAKNSFFGVKNTKKCRLRRKFFGFWVRKGGRGVPPFSVKFFSLTLQKNLVR